MNWKNIFARKDLEALLAEAAGEHRLHRVLGPWSLTALGVGCIIGAGIFVMTGRAAALDAGPAVIFSYAIAGLGCALAALCYAEFAAMAPVAGSAYTYAYTTLGEIFAWIIGWDLILEYAMGCATVASAWTNYFNKLLEALGSHAAGSRRICPRIPSAADPQSAVGPDHGGHHDHPRARHPRKRADQRHARGHQAGRRDLRDRGRLGLREPGELDGHSRRPAAIPAGEEVIPDAVKKYLKDHEERLRKHRIAELEKRGRSPPTASSERSKRWTAGRTGRTATRPKPVKNWPS